MSRAAVLIALLAAACKADFRPQYLVRDLRVLSIRAEVVGSPAPGVADPDLGQTLRLSALVVDPLARTDLRVEWLACLPDPSTTVPPCLDPAALRDLDQLATRPGVVRIGEGLSIDVAIPSALQPAVDALLARAEARPELTCSLYVELPVLAIARAGSEVRTAVKPVRVAPQASLRGTRFEGAYLPNLNPRIIDLRAGPTNEDRCTGGVSLSTSLPPGAQTLCGAMSVSSVEGFPQCDPSGARAPLAEDLSWQWYATGGTFDTGSGGLDVGNATGRWIQFTPPAGPFTLWLILRDGRGGEDWMRADLR